MHYSMSTARFTAATDDLIMRPRITTTQKPPVIYCSGGGDTALNGAGAATAILEALVAVGYSVFIPSVPWTLGNSTAVTGITNAVTYARANGCTDAAPVLIGKSNGSLGCMQYARQNPVSALVTMLSPVDLEYARTNDVLSTRARFDTAWGVTYPTPLPAHADIWTDRALYVGKPIQRWDSSNDDFDNPAKSMASFGASIGAEVHSLGPLGHTDAAVLTVPPASVVQFIQNRVGN